MRHLKLVKNDVKTTEKQQKKSTKLKKQIENYLENECCFRDYTFKKAEAYGTYSAVGQHIKIEQGDDIEYIIDDALDGFLS